MGPGLPPNRTVLKRRLLLVALDAMDVQWLRALAVRGDLPNLARFIVSAQGAEVRSDGGTLHGPVWPTFAPGAGPGHHGRYWWMQWLPQDMRYVRSSHPAFAYDPFWLGIAEAGRRVVVLDVPYAPLVRHPLVEQITGWGSHDGVEEESWPGVRDAVWSGYSDDTRSRWTQWSLTRRASSYAWRTPC